MAARGSILKNEIITKILETFPDSFLYNDGKEVRINGLEEGTPLQIKLTFTCAKVAVDNPNTAAAPASAPAPTNAVIEDDTPPFDIEPSAEEKARLAKLRTDLGF